MTAPDHITIALVRALDTGKPDSEGATGHLETWAYDASRNEWQKMDPPAEPPGFGSRRRCMIYLPDQNLVLLENRGAAAETPQKENEQQIWTYLPPLPSRERDGVRVKPSEDQPAGLAESPKPLRTEPSPRPSPGYRAREQSSTARQPRIVEDAIVSVISTKEVRLSWKPPVCGTAVGYHIERAPVEVYSEDQVARLTKELDPLPEPSVGAVKAIGQFTRITDKPLKETTYTDPGIDLTKPQLLENPQPVNTFRGDQLNASGKPYRFAVFAYRIRAVNAQGGESGPSPFFLTIPSSPKHVFSKETGQRCDIKWAANPEQKPQRLPHLPHDRRPAPRPRHFRPHYRDDLHSRRRRPAHRPLSRRRRRCPRPGRHPLRPRLGQPRMETILPALHGRVAPVTADAFGVIFRMPSVISFGAGWRWYMAPLFVRNITFF